MRSVPLFHVWGVCLGRVDWGKETRNCHLVLWSRTINIAPLHGRTNLTTRVRIQSLETILGRYKAPKTARPMLWLLLIMSYFLILLKVHSILYLKHKHLSIQYDISSQTLTYIYHGNHLITTLAYIYHDKPLIQGSKQNKAASIHGRITNMARSK